MPPTGIGEKRLLDIGEIASRRRRSLESKTRRVETKIDSRRGYRRSKERLIWLLVAPSTMAVTTTASALSATASSPTSRPLSHLAN